MLLRRRKLYLAAGALARSGRTCLIMEVLVQTRFQRDELPGVAGKTKRFGRSIVGLGKILLHIVHADLLGLIEIFIPIRHVNSFKRLLHLIEVLCAGKAAACAVLGPLVLDQSFIRKVFQHVLHYAACHRTRRFAAQRLHGIMI